MSPQEKAKELYAKMEGSITALESLEWWNSAKQCAIIAVDEMINMLLDEYDGYVSNILTDYLHFKIKYWQQVKEEITKL